MSGAQALKRATDQGRPMFRVTRGVSRGFRLSAFGLVVAVGAVAVAPDTADARRYRRQHVAQQQQKVSHRVSHHSVRDSGYSPPFASIVVDANTGQTIDEKNADGLRHPASLT
jgi:D-alanyl-D-alanine carboxypeptidase